MGTPSLNACCTPVVRQIAQGTCTERQNAKFAKPYIGAFFQVVPTNVSAALKLIPYMQYVKSGVQGVRAFGDSCYQAKH